MLYTICFNLDQSKSLSSGNGLKLTCLCMLHKFCGVIVCLLFSTEDQLFWRAIVQLGLVDEFFREIKSKLDMLKFNMVKNFVNLTGNFYSSLS